MIISCWESSLRLLSSKWDTPTDGDVFNGVPIENNAINWSTPCTNALTVGPIMQPNSDITEFQLDLT